MMGFYCLIVSCSVKQKIRNGLLQSVQSIIVSLFNCIFVMQCQSAKLERNLEAKKYLEL